MQATVWNPLKRVCLLLFNEALCSGDSTLGDVVFVAISTAILRFQSDALLMLTEPRVLTFEHARNLDRLHMFIRLAVSFYSMKTMEKHRVDKWLAFLSESRNAS